MSPTPIADSWTAPPTPRDSSKLFKNIIGGTDKDDAVRRIAEDKMAGQVKGRGIQSYQYFTSADFQSGESIMNEKFKRDGFDGIVIMRLLQGRDRFCRGAGQYANPNSSWYGYYSSSFPGFVNNNISANTVYHIQTNVYSLTADKLLWTGVTTAVKYNRYQPHDRWRYCSGKTKDETAGLIK